jgi:hypothetical protein
MTHRSGDVVSPWIEAAEPLSLELADFVRAIRTGEEPRSSVALGLEIVYALEAAEASLQAHGQPVMIERPVPAAAVVMPYGNGNGNGHANGNGHNGNGNEHNGNGHANGPANGKGHNGNGHANGSGNKGAGGWAARVADSQN